MDFLKPSNLLHIRKYIFLDGKRKRLNEIISPYNFGIYYFKGTDRKPRMAVLDNPSSLEDIALHLIHNSDEIRCAINRGEISVISLSYKLFRKIRQKVEERDFNYLKKSAIFFSQETGWPIQ